MDYGGHTAVHDLSLTLAPGEIFGLAGPNGAGKTSTIRVLAALLEPTHGDVEIAGYDLFREPGQVHAVLGYMPDLAPVIPDLKVWEFLDLYAHSYGLRGSEKRDRVDACLGRVKLSGSRDVYGRALSRGMTQRVVLAKTLLHEPRVMLLDEPASGMDPIARRDLRHILQEVSAAGTAVIISSHILSELSDMCTSFGIMHKGHLLQHGSMEMIRQTLHVGAMQLQIEFVERAQEAAKRLAARDDVDAVDSKGDRVEVTFNGDATAVSGLLQSLLTEGFHLKAFSSGKPDIEAMLMQLVDERSD